jgi:hypothetical protein
MAVRILPDDPVEGFGEARTISPGNDAFRVAVGDLNGDAIPDLVVIGHDHNFNARLGLGGGRFGPVTRYALRNHGTQIAVADLNGDPYADVVAAHDGSGNPVYVTAFLGSATGGLHQVWEVGTTYSTARGIATGDFDGDGRTDLAVAVSDSRASVLVFSGLGTGAFGPLVALPTVSPDPHVSDGTTALAAGDLDADGRDDLVIACYAFTNQLVVRLGTASGCADPARIALPSPVGVALGDMDGDGRLDAVVPNLEDRTLSLLHGLGDGSFDRPTTLPAGREPSSVTMGDFDGDGRADVAATDLADHVIRV